MTFTQKQLRYLHIVDLLILTFAVYLIFDGSSLQGILLGLISSLLNYVYPPDYRRGSFLSGKTTSTFFIKDGSRTVEMFCEVVAVLLVGFLMSVLF
ncbi:hypothetical protein [Enterococcus sp. DIV0876]|uniref:hypothetical protein n=1 Tax=Enterococcus sp. DIV0876 TaxID=2774633 RepID=UPI003D2FA1F8